ncbi:UDP-N-acetylmuramoyl-tripeptide--D-alanyl-D-alanine ligase [Sphingomonas nostoxanthinifaciens]|uniref:UDP-N-acetylmuramoyl-tripeptide--D-alanyl-D- alanine ligase n=1 Tax=Sphingomonas nostoxanthinifaciens TaxID=2872652 RepID=UPI001CC20201|nr:UDP-N-acetylmuramoyl-tripeptide--D-alanyl-D-alanine ligase [Sphingomonas nostoxanthinifaciens]UAK24938.1 UDP-N-acetylmuramoyl-tripeptide--D-alanyl-D-alanine ligase [Sphingomonas nostoxanthinifaciens]
MTPLWTAQEVAAATGGSASADFAANGVAFDSREVGPGDLFVALKGDATDGHRFVAQAFAQGAAGAIVSQPVDGPHVLVADTSAALDVLGAASRARTAATIVGVTGSVGKTSVKEALFAALDRSAPGAVHRSLKSYNNHVGVPLSLARMPRETRFAVFEMGMNHAGELAALTRLVRPHVAIVTAIALAHGAFFADEAAIAEAKSEIFEGLEPAGTAITPYDSPHRERLIAAARAHAGQITTFGRDPAADIYAGETIRLARGTFVSARLRAARLSFTLAPPGEHWVSNALAILAAVEVAGGDLALAGLALAELEGLAGRGRRLTVVAGDGEALLIDESYNANPASMRATLAVLGQEKAARRIAILGGMRELGPDEARHHAELAGPVMAAGVGAALLVGNEMAALAAALEGRLDLVHVPDAAAASAAAKSMVAPGDVILVKGSNSFGLASVVAALAGVEG